MLDPMYDTSTWFYPGWLNIKYIQQKFQSAGKGKHLRMVVSPIGIISSKSQFELKQQYYIHHMCRRQRKCMPRGKAFERMLVLELFK